MLHTERALLQLSLITPQLDANLISMFTLLMQVPLVELEHRLWGRAAAGRLEVITGYAKATLASDLQ